MASLKIRKYPDPILRRLSEEIHQVDDNIQVIIDDMFETMDEEEGVGLAAPQVGISKRIIVVSLEKDKGGRLALINPVIDYLSDEREYREEGCLSIPGVNAEVLRPIKVMVHGYARSGRLIEVTAHDLLARALQHEIDHLNGVLFIDRLDGEEKKRIASDLEALQKDYGIPIHLQNF